MNKKDSRGQGIKGSSEIILGEIEDVESILRALITSLKTLYFRIVEPYLATKMEKILKFFLKNEMPILFNYFISMCYYLLTRGNDVQKITTYLFKTL